MRYQVKITAVWTDKYTIEATDQRRVRRGSNWTRPPCIVTNMDCPTDRYLPYNLPCPWPQCFIMRIAQFDQTPTPLPLVPPTPPPPNCENVFFKWGAHLITRNCSSLGGWGVGGWNGLGQDGPIRLYFMPASKGHGSWRKRGLTCLDRERERDRQRQKELELENFILQRL